MHKSFFAAALMAVSATFLFGCGSGDDNAASPDGGSKGGTVDAQADVEHRRNTTAADYVACCWFIYARHNTQQCGFACAIATNQGNTVAGFE